MRRGAAFAYNLNWNGRPGQAEKSWCEKSHVGRRQLCKAASSSFSVERSFDQDRALGAIRLAVSAPAARPQMLLLR